MKSFLHELTSRWEYFLTLFSEHLLICSLALFLVGFFGLSIGILVFYSSKARCIILPIVNFFYSIPSIALFGLLIPLVGIGLNNAIIVLVLYGLLPIVHSTYNGLNEVPEQFVDAGIGLGSNKKQLFFNVYFPLALPSILAGFRVTTVMVISLGGLAALIGAGGLGQAIFRGLNTANSNLIVIGSFGISFFAVLGDKFVSIFQIQNKLQKLISGNAEKKQRQFIFLNLSVLGILLVSSFLYVNPLKSQKENIKIASKLTSEQFILGEIVAQLIEKNTKLEVQREFGIGGGTTNIHPALLENKLDIYVEYTGTSWTYVLKHKVKEKIVFQNLQKEYLDKFKLRYIGLLGFNNTYALAILKKDAEIYNIKTYSDLVLKSSLFEFGAEFDFFEREDAYAGLMKTYGFRFKKIHEMDINLRYKAIKEGKINAVDVFTTDAQIEANDLKVLDDDKGFFPEYKAGIVVREEILQKYPYLEKLLEKLNGKIDDKKMRKLNYEVEILKKKPKEVASKFLKEAKL